MRAGSSCEESCSREGAAISLDSLAVRPIVYGERKQWDELMAKHHYLGLKGIVGETMRYVALLDGKWVALLGWGAAAFKSAHRERWIGWDASLQWGRLKLIANNVRYLILPGVKIPNLASKTLSLNIKRLSDDWKTQYGHPILVAETFVDQSRYRGTCYRAAGWLELGETKGFGRNGGRYYEHGRKKTLFVNPLRKGALRLLADPWPHPELLVQEPMMNITACRLEGLLDYLREVPDPRMKRGIRHQMLSVLAVSVCAVMSGARNFAALADWAQACTQKTRSRLECRFKDGRYMPPSEPTIRRMLRDIDADALDRAVNAWLLTQSPLEEGRAVAVDGKTLRGARNKDGKQVHLISAILHREKVVIAQDVTQEKSNAIPAFKSMLAEMDIKGAVVTADAMHTQKDTAQFIKEKKEADYLFTVKDNQPALREDIAALGLESFPPCV